MSDNRRTVWLVGVGEYEQWGVDAVFTTRAVAEERAKLIEGEVLRFHLAATLAEQKLIDRFGIDAYAESVRPGGSKARTARLADLTEKMVAAGFDPAI